MHYNVYYYFIALACLCCNIVGYYFIALAYLCCNIVGYYPFISLHLFTILHFSLKLFVIFSLCLWLQATPFCYCNYLILSIFIKYFCYFLAFCYPNFLSFYRTSFEFTNFFHFLVWQRLKICCSLFIQLWKKDYLQFLLHLSSIFLHGF